MLTTFAIRAGCAVFQTLPERQALRLGRGLGLLWYHAVRYRRAHVRRSLSLAFHDLTSHELRALTRANFVHYGQVLAETARLPLLVPASLARHVEFTGSERFEEARARGRGVVLISGHYGNWDLLAVAQALAGYEIHVVTRRLHSRGADRAWQEMRRAQGVRFLPDHGSSRDILRLLRAGKTVGLILDQHVGGRRGVPVRFLGRPAWTARAAAVLAARTGCAVLPVFNCRGDGRYHVEFGPEIPLAVGRDAAETELLTTQRYSDVLEAFIRRHPEQWLWAHRRWKEG
ncbi:MAG: lysophospholipid acyltransferase family protein [Candidatus Krumholzibacteriia bacterium]